MCTHETALNEALEGVVPLTGAPIYVPTTPGQLAAIVEHNLTCWK